MPYKFGLALGLAACILGLAPSGESTPTAAPTQTLAAPTPTSVPRSPSPSPTIAPASATVSPGDVTTREVRVGEDLIITLDSNPTTGFRWQITQAPDEKVLKLQGTGSTFVPPAQPRPGAGGQERWTFQGVAAGKTTVPLGYARSFEPNNPPVQRVTYEVTVR